MELRARGQAPAIPHTTIATRGIRRPAAAIQQDEPGSYSSYQTS